MINIKSRGINLGERFPSNGYGDFQVIGYEDKEKYLIRFLKTGYTLITNTWSIRTGKVRDKLQPSIQNFGFIGDGEYSSSSHPSIYKKWSRMIERVYGNHHPAYQDCTISTRWANFQNFAKDFITLPGYQEDLTGLHFDKDTIKPGNRTYAKEFCSLIPASLNCSFVPRRGKRNY
ncbi:hypothetical protein ABDC18_002873 [Escherichia coli]